MGFGIWELLIILVILLVLFGAKRLRNVGGDLGSAVKGFRKAIKDEETKPVVDKSAESEKMGQTIEGEAKKEDEKV